MGGSTSFTDDVYVPVAEEMQDAAMSAIAAFVPRKNAGTVQPCASTGGRMMMENTSGTPLPERNAWSAAEAPGFEPGRGVNPNRIRSSVSGTEAGVSGGKPEESAQVSGGAALPWESLSHR